MTDHQELKRLAEAAKACAHLSYYTSHEGDFQVAASPDVVLKLLAEIELLNAHCNQKGLQLVAMDNLTSDLQDERDTLRTRNQALREALKDATDEIESWGAYASEYFQAKHDLAGNVAKFRAIIQAEGGV